jgi:hypothetical protein
MRSTTELRQHSLEQPGGAGSQAGGAYVLGQYRLSTRPGTVYRRKMSEAEKKARLAEALRANLRKRKTQARAQAAAGDAPDSQSDATQSETRPAAS